MHACLSMVHCCNGKSMRMHAATCLVTHSGCSMLQPAQVYSTSLANEEGVRIDKLGDRRTS